MLTTYLSSSNYKYLTCFMLCITQVKRTIEQSSDVAAKKQRFDENESLRMRQQFQMKMAAPKVTSITSNIDR